MLLQKLQLLIHYLSSEFKPFLLLNITIRKCLLKKNFNLFAFLKYTSRSKDQGRRNYSTEPGNPHLNLFTYCFIESEKVLYNFCVVNLLTNQKIKPAANPKTVCGAY